MNEFISDWVAGMLIVFAESIEQVGVILGKSLTSNLSMWNMVSTVHNIIKPICYSILVVIFLKELITLTIKMDVLKWEYVFKLLTKLVISQACISYGADLIECIYSTSAYWIKEYTEGMSTDYGFYATISTELNSIVSGMGLLKTVGFAITCIIPMILLMLCGLFVKLIAYGRMIEIYIYMALMPLPFAFILDGEGNANMTKKYLLNFASICLQGFLIVVATSLYQYLMSDEITNQYNLIVAGGTPSASNLLFTLVIGGLVMALAVGKCGQISKTILNAH